MRDVSYYGKWVKLVMDVVATLCERDGMPADHAARVVAWAHDRKETIRDAWDAWDSSAELGESLYHLSADYV